MIAGGDADDKTDAGVMGAAPVNVSTWHDKSAQPRFEAMPKAPLPLGNDQMQPFHTQAEKQGLGDRETLAQYRRVTTGLAMNSGHSSGWSEDNVRINREALVYIKSMSPHGTQVSVQVIKPRGVQEWEYGPVLPFGECIFKFTGNMGEWYFAVDSKLSDAYMLKIEIWTKVDYAR